MSNLHSSKDKLPSLKASEEKSVDPHSIGASKSVSFLPPQTLRWINKRRPASEEETAKFMTASRALQLRNVFRSLDFDGSGSIELDELKQAINFVAKPRDGGAPIIDDPDKINKFFESMDLDGNGAVDFNEFLIGMTAQEESSSQQVARMQQAFFDFANMHRRQMIIETVEKDVKSDLEKFTELKNLFSIQFLREEPVLRTVEEQIKKAQSIAMEEMKEMSSETRRTRAVELVRSKNAASYFNCENANSRNDPMTVSAALRKSRIDDGEVVTLRVEKKVRDSMSKYRLDNPYVGFTPSLRTVKSDSQLRYGALLEARGLKTGLSKQAVMLPPVSMKEQIHQRALSTSNGPSS